MNVTKAFQTLSALARVVPDLSKIKFGINEGWGSLKVEVKDGVTKQELRFAAALANTSMRGVVCQLKHLDAFLKCDGNLNVFAELVAEEIDQSEEILARLSA